MTQFSFHFEKPEKLSLEEKQMAHGTFYTSPKVEANEIADQITKSAPGQ